MQSLIAASCFACTLAVSSCSRAPPEQSAPAATSVATPATSAKDLLAARPYALHTPTAHDPAAPMPLVVVMCGYDAPGAICESFFEFPDLSKSESFVYVVLDGTVDSAGHRFWNATDACCNKHGSNVDDVAYVRAVLDDVGRKQAVDPKRVFVFGFSNGGFFAHRLACELSDRVAAVASMAGATWKDPARCMPSSPVAVVEIHGDADEVVPYAGGRIPFDAGTPPGDLPSARETVAFWALKDRCPEPAAQAPEMDLDPALAGAETSVDRYVGCGAGSGVELWSVHGETHIPHEHTSIARAAYAFFRAHPKG